MVHRILVDGRSSANILYKETFEKMGLEASCLKPVSYPVIKFAGAYVVSEATIKLPVKLGEVTHSRDMMGEFLVVDVPTTYNAIIGRPLIHDAQTVGLHLPFDDDLHVKRRQVGEDQGESRVRQCLLSDGPQHL